MESKFGSQNGNDLDGPSQPVYMCVRNFAGLLKAMNRKVTHFHSKAERNHMETAELGPAAGNLLDLFDQTTTHHGLK